MMTQKLLLMGQTQNTQPVIIGEWVQMGGVVHVLLVIAISVLVVQLDQERNQAYVCGEFVHVQYAEVREGLRFSLNKIK